MIPAAESDVSVERFATTYDRVQCQIGFVHLGFGAFHRAHQAVYIDDYMQATGDLHWGIAAVNLRPTESEAFKAVQSTDDGYLLKTTSPQGITDLRVVRSHCRYEDWSVDAEKAEALLSLPTVHTITVTVTESGYYLNDDWTLNIDDPVIAQELKGGPAGSVYAYLARALKQRSMATGAPINLLCCDNIRSNGKMLESSFLAYLRHIGDHELENWVRTNASFPCSMVDRITPRATSDLVEEVANLFPVENLSPIHGEAFTQWVLENNFKAPFPDLTKAGVEIVDDVDPYEEAKIRILNGGHTGLCYLGALAGYETFDQAIHDEKLRNFFDAFEINEVLPGLDLDLPFDRRAYLSEITARFSNRAIADQLERICMDGYSKMPIYIRPTLASCFKQGIYPQNSLECAASWYVYARRFSQGKMAVKYHEPYWDQLEPLLAKGQEENFARTKQLWADLPDTYPQFVSGLMSAIEKMETQWPA